VNLELELAVRFLRRRSGPLLRGTSLAALASVSLATSALVITLALMGGYSEAIAAALQTGNAHLVGFSPRPLPPSLAEAVAGQLLEVEGVRRATPVTYLSGLVEDPNRPTNPLPITVKAVADPPPYTGLIQWPSDDGIPAVFGARLAASLGLDTGATATVRLPPKAGSWILPGLRLAVTGTFSLAFSEFDESWIVVPLARVVEAVPGTGAAGVEVEIDDPLAVEAVRRKLEEVEPSLMYTDWREMNRSLFAALRWQTLSLFVVLSLVVAVASFQVSSALVVLAIDKRRTSGMLQALGATPARIRRVMLYSGLLLGGTGVVCGLVLGCSASWVMTALRLVRFPSGLARVYMVDFIPLRPEPIHLLAVLGVCSALVFLASLWPAWRTSRSEPVAALKAV
jgi:lipoprotein-releasing system permease protein